MMSFADQYRRWFEYEQDSHAKVLVSLARVPENLRTAETFQKAATLMAHMIAARRLWLYRLGGAAEPPSDLFPRNVRLDDLKRELGQIESAWSGYLARLTDADLARRFQYRSLEGEWYANTIEEILAQLFGHSWYHRGQIAALIRSLGCEPAVTDFVFWTRQAITVPVTA
ncbi:MAG TPA: DinB family protein [Bryobacteraceae bacterium]|nr:DinB family protein [Bryobacteraceae bacterium]